MNPKLNPKYFEVGYVFKYSIESTYSSVGTTTSYVVVTEVLSLGFLFDTIFKISKNYIQGSQELSRDIYYSTYNNLKNDTELISTTNNLNFRELYPEEFI